MAGSMMMVGGKTFEMQCDTIDVTSMSRPDTNWRFTDSHGHEHRWYTDDKPAESYDPNRRYDVPSIVWIHEYWGYYPDGERYSCGHYDCRACGDLVEQPRNKPDDTTQYIAGMRHYRVDGETVSEDEFKRLYIAEGGKL